jgi:hypothetical protein
MTSEIFNSKVSRKIAYVILILSVQFKVVAQSPSLKNASKQIKFLRMGSVILNLVLTNGDLVKNGTSEKILQ